MVLTPKKDLALLGTGCSLNGARLGRRSTPPGGRDCNYVGTDPETTFLTPAPTLETRPDSCEIVVLGDHPKPANEVITDFGAETADENAAVAPLPGHSRSASTCEPCRDVIDLGLSRGRNVNVIW